MERHAVVDICIIIMVIIFMSYWGALSISVAILNLSGSFCVLLLVSVVFLHLIVASKKTRGSPVLPAFGAVTDPRVTTRPLRKQTQIKHNWTVALIP